MLSFKARETAGELPMGEKRQEAMKFQFDKWLRLEFHGATITSEAGLLACRELGGTLGLTEEAPAYLREIRGGRNVHHGMVLLLQQSVYARLGGYEDTNDVVKYPAMQVADGRRTAVHGGSQQV